MQLFIARLLKGYTQHELADKTAIPRYKICYFENGYKRPNEAELANLAKTLAVKADELEFDKRELRDSARMDET